SLAAPPSLALRAMQLRLEAVGVFKIYRHLVGLEGKYPILRFAVAQDTTLQPKRVLVEPAPPDGVDPVEGRRALSKDPVEPHQSRKMLRGPIGFSGVGRDLPGGTRIEKIQHKGLHAHRI